MVFEDSLKSQIQLKNEHSMKILHVITSLATGGAENLVAQIVPRFIKSGFDVEVALFIDTDTSFKRQLTDAGVKVHCFSKGGSVYNPLHIIRLRRLLKQFDVIHTHNYAPQIFAAIANIGIRKILFTTEHNTSNRRRSWKGYAVIDRWMYSRYNRIICISKKAEENLRAFIASDSKRIVTINNGIDTKKFSEAEALPGFRPSTVKAITMVAAFRWEKDQDTLIRAMSLLPKYFHLYLVGNGVRRKVCEALANELHLESRIHFLGLRNDVPHILKASDYIVMSSHFEGLSLSSLEGMAAGRPFLASDVDGLRDVVKGAGVLFKHKNAKDLADKIQWIDSTPEIYESVAANCSKHAADYDITIMVSNYITAYKNE